MASHCPEPGRGEGSSRVSGDTALLTPQPQTSGLLNRENPFLLFKLPVCGSLLQSQETDPGPLSAPSLRGGLIQLRAVSSVSTDATLTPPPALPPPNAGLPGPWPTWSANRQLRRHRSPTELLFFLPDSLFPSWFMAPTPASGSRHKLRPCS